MAISRRFYVGGEGKTIPLSFFYLEEGRGGNDDIPTP